VLAMTGGGHTLYKTDGVFDEAKWRGAMDRFNTPSIRTAVADGVADGTIIGNSVMDEPQQDDHNSEPRGQSWGPSGTMTRARVDGLCSYVKGIFPTLPVGVFHDGLMFDPNNDYQVCEFLMTPYGARKGNISTWRDAQLGQTNRAGMSIIFSLNIVNGGKQDKDGTYDCAGTGGMGSYYPNCSMTPEQIETWGRLLGPQGCALYAYRYENPLLDKPAHQEALSNVAIYLTDFSRTPCTGSRRSNTPPTPLFAFSCSDLACDFVDGSRDDDGVVSAWSWDFGDGKSSTAASPSHEYAAEGSYEVSLSVTDDDGATDVIRKTVTVTAPPPPPSNREPTAAFSFSCDNLACGFTDESLDPDGTVVSWRWSFGDGTSSTDQSPGHAYDQEGSYEVTLEVTDDGGATGSVTRTATASQAPE
jgi:chitodextrinase